MKKSLSCLTSILCLSWSATGALADPPAQASDEVQRAASALVQDKLVRPLDRSGKRRKLFSRTRPAPTERRVRVLDRKPQQDPRGKYFLRFAIDVRTGFSGDHDWQQDTLVGCAYPTDGEVYVQSKRGFVPARTMLGKPGAPRDFACRAASAEVAQVHR